MSVHSLAPLVTLLLYYTLFASAVPLDIVSAFMNAASTPGSTLTDTDGGPLARLSVARRFNATGSTNVVRFDQARARALKNRFDGGAGYASSENFVNVAATSQVVCYVVEVLVGTPPQSYQLLVDTGSSNTWIGANKKFCPTSSTKPTGSTFVVTYGSGDVTGEEVLETVTLAQGLTLTDQSIGIAALDEGFNGVDGILGIGPQGLTRGSFLPNMNKTAPTVIDTAWAEGLLDSYSIGISFNPSNQLENKNGELTFGGVDMRKYTGALNWTPLTKVQPASNYVGIDQSITYGTSNKVVLHKTAGILDTGTTLILLASGRFTHAYSNYQKLTGGVEDDDVGLLRITPQQYSALQSLYFHVGGQTYELTPNAQIWPRALNEAIGGESDCIYLIVADFGSKSGEGLDFINGMSFLERFYMVYDVGNSRAGLATTPYTNSYIN